MKLKMGRFTVGEIVEHFKRDPIADKYTTNYLYRIIAFATHTETRETLVVYQALYGDHEVYVRPYDMFASKVDKNKYPDAKAVYRLSKFRGDLAHL